MSEVELVLEGPVTIAKAESLHHEFESAINDAANIKVDARNVERADTSIIQLLASLCDTAEGLDLHVKIEASSGLVDCTNLLGFTELRERFV